MRCDRCKMREAKYRVMESLNGEEEEHNLCPHCAAELGLLNSFSVFQNFFSPDASGISNPSERCPHCGRSYAEFRSTGLLGCPHCYESFESRLPYVIRRVQAGMRHLGRKPGEAKAAKLELKLSQPDGVNQMDSASTKSDEVSGGTNLDALRKARDRAIAREDYEKAAELRDQIRAIEAGTNPVHNAKAKQNLSETKVPEDKKTISEDKSGEEDSSK